MPSNKPLEWTGLHRLSASPPKIPACHSGAAFGMYKIFCLGIDNVVLDFALTFPMFITVYCLGTKADFDDVPEIFDLMDPRPGAVSTHAASAALVLPAFFPLHHGRITLPSLISCCGTGAIWRCCPQAVDPQSSQEPEPRCNPGMLSPRHPREPRPCRARAAAPRRP